MARRSKRRDQGEGWTLVRECATCRRPQSECNCKTVTPPGGRPIARIRLEKRRGKPVSVVAFEGLPDSDAKAYSRELKSACGVGGTYKNGELELQGDHREKLRPWLAERGMQVKG